MNCETDAALPLFVGIPLLILLWAAAIMLVILGIEITRDFLAEWRTRREERKFRTSGKGGLYQR